MKKNNERTTRSEVDDDDDYDYNYNAHCIKIREFIKSSLQTRKKQSLLLSGGLDSSILASLIKPENSFTVSLNGNGNDLFYSSIIAKKFSKKHFEIIITNQELIGIIERIICIFKTFDPIEIKNSSVIYAGLHSAKSNGIDSIVTGDGGDEIFAGYNYLKRYYNDEMQLKKEIERLNSIMHFSSKVLGDFFKIKIISPFLDPNLVKYTNEIIDIKEKMGYHNKQLFGKLILRKCFQRDLGDNIVWRGKSAQQDGSGFSDIVSFIDKRISDLELQKGIEIGSTEGVKIRDKEHLFYYTIFRKHFSPPKLWKCISKKRCPQCSGCFIWNGNFCRICGGFPVIPHKIE